MVYFEHDGSDVLQAEEMPKPRPPYWRQVSVIEGTMSSQKEFRDVMRPMVRGALAPIVHKVLPTSGAKEAHETPEKGEQFGETVLVPS